MEEKNLLTIFSILGFIASIICACLCPIVYFLNRKSSLNFLFASAALFAAYLTFTESMVWQASNPESALWWDKAGFLWPFYIAFVVNFIIAFANSKLFKSKIFYAVLYVPAIVLSLISLLIDPIYSTVIEKYWGYAVSFSNTWSTILSTVWASGITLLSMYLCIKYYFEVTDETKKQQAKWITIGFCIPASNYIITNLAPAFGIETPELGGISTAMLGCFVVYAIWKYELFSLNPVLAAENIISTMPDSLILADSKNQILRVNKAFVSFLGYTEKELSGKSVSDLFSNLSQGVKIMEELYCKREIAGLETKVKTKLGEEKTVLFSGSIVRNKRAQDIGITIIIHDITNRKLMEEKLIKAERFASIGELAGMVGHDLRNPLTSIRTATFYLKKKYSATMSNSEKEMFNAIDNSVVYSDKIITDLLDYSKTIILDSELISLEKLVSNMLKVIDIPQNIEVKNLSENSLKLNVDEVKMNRVFSNIAKNAFDAMPNGGVLTISSKKINGNLNLQFCDLGEGMSEDTLRKLWVPLFTTKAKGIGFGLSICKRIVEAHGGRISAESTIGKGTTITVMLPLNEEQSGTKEKLVPLESSLS